MEEKKNNLIPIPVVGEFYHFWDDGKSSVGRHYIAKCEEIISLAEAKTLFTKNIFTDVEGDDGEPTIISLYDTWVLEKVRCDFLYAKDTDCIVKCSIPKYDDNPIYFGRTVDGGWFSFDFTSCWQGGRLDVTGEKFNYIIKSYEEDTEFDNSEIINAYKSTTY